MNVGVEKGRHIGQSCEDSNKEQIHSSKVLGGRARGMKAEPKGVKSAAGLEAALRLSNTVTVGKGLSSGM